MLELIELIILVILVAVALPIVICVFGLLEFFGALFGGHILLILLVAAIGLLGCRALLRMK